MRPWSSSGGVPGEGNSGPQTARMREAERADVFFLFPRPEWRRVATAPKTGLRRRCISALMLESTPRSAQAAAGARGAIPANRGKLWQRSGLKPFGPGLAFGSSHFSADLMAVARAASGCGGTGYRADKETR
jgi:hypothetical protein